MCELAKCELTSFIATTGTETQNKPLMRLAFRSCSYHRERLSPLLSFAMFKVRTTSFLIFPDSSTTIMLFDAIQIVPTELQKH